MFSTVQYNEFVKGYLLGCGVDPLLVRDYFVLTTFFFAFIIKKYEQL